MRGDGEGEAQVHAARVVLHGGIDELFDLGKGDDLVEFLDNFQARHAEKGAVENNIFAAREIRMKSGANFQQRCDSAPQCHPAGRRGCNSAKQFEQGGFACTISADDSDNFAGLNLEGYVP